MPTIAERYAEELGRTPEGEIPNKLRELRKAKGLVLNDVAEVLKITLGYLSQLERGENEPSLSLAVKIAKFYGKRIDEIWSFAAVEIDVGGQI